jgi:hypothetical protein
MEITRDDVKFHRRIQKQIVTRAREIFYLCNSERCCKLDYINISFSRNNKTVIIDCAGCSNIYSIKIPFEVFIGDYKNNMQKIKYKKGN